MDGIQYIANYQREEQPVSSTIMTVFASSRTAIVATRFDHTRELLRNGLGVYAVHFNSVNSMYQALHAVLSSRNNNYDKRKLLRGMYWEVVAKKILSFNKDKCLTNISTKPASVPAEKD